MKTALFDFELPQELIAQKPAAVRSASRLLVYDRVSQRVDHKSFKDIISYIKPGDLLVVNRSRVIPARLFTVAEHSGKPAEILWVRNIDETHCEAMVRPGRKFRIGAEHLLPGGGKVTVESVSPDGLRILRFDGVKEVLEAFRRYGEMPLPHYIKSGVDDPERYQTVFADEEGSIAAPTAGLHFDEALLETLRLAGVKIAFTLLHVGLGTFTPVKSEEVEEHKMHTEKYYISPELAAAYASVRAEGRSVWACGTTSVRSLESSAAEDGNLRIGWRETDCFITPGYTFKAVDHLITNFHLPKSSLIMLVAAFCGREKILELYKEAIDRKYRFFSFGDAMAII